MNSPFPALPSPAASLAHWAAWYAAQGIPVFPCTGKRPLTVHGFFDASTDAFQVSLWWERWPQANIGTPTGQWCWVLDVDPRHGGDRAFAAFEAQYGWPEEPARSHTGGGGWHLIFLPDTRVRHHHARLQEQGLDVQAVGGYIILPPSIHPHTGQSYLWDLGYDLESPGLIAAPEWLITLASDTGGAQQGGSPGKPSTDAGEAIPEGTRENTLVRIGAAMRHAGSAYPEIYAALTQANARCAPPLADPDIQRIARSVTRYDIDPVLEVSRASPMVSAAMAAETMYQASEEVIHDAEGSGLPILRCDKGGRPYPDAGNFWTIFQGHPFWRGRFWWDDVQGCPMLDKAPLKDSDIADIAAWLGKKMTMSVRGTSLLQQVIFAIAERNSRDLIQEFFAALPSWDGVPRIENWAIDCCGTPDTQANRFISRTLFAALVARALQPGCIMRYVFILHGPQNTGKTTLVRILGDPWHAVIDGSIDTKEIYMEIQGVWIAELAELNAFSRTERTRLKSFITKVTDSWVPKYSNIRKTVARRTVFIGTTNDVQFLSDETGNTRYLPLSVGENGPMDLPAMQQLREQLFAEALLYWRAHQDTWWQIPTDVAPEIWKQQEDVVVDLPHEEPLEAWLRTWCDGTWANAVGLPRAADQETITWAELAEHFLRLPIDRWDERGRQSSMGKTMIKLGWSKGRWRSGPRKDRWYWKKP